MSAYWEGNLRNTVADVLIDAAVTVLIVCAYLPQLLRLRTNSPSRGISAYYILFNVLFSNALLSEMLQIAAFAWPTASKPVLEELIDGKLRGREAFGGILGILQIFIQWACSIAQLLLFVARSQCGALSGRAISMIACLHVAAVLILAVVLSLPPASNHTMFTGIFMALVGMSNLVVAPCFGILQFWAQYREAKNQHGNPGALSLLSIGLQLLAMLILSVRWLLRLGSPPWGWDFFPTDIRIWYEWSFPAINYFLYALGCALLLAFYAFTRQSRASPDDLEERAPLLR